MALNSPWEHLVILHEDVKKSGGKNHKERNRPCTRPKTRVHRRQFCSVFRVMLSFEKLYNPMLVDKVFGSIENCYNCRQNFPYGKNHIK